MPKNEPAKIDMIVEVVPHPNWDHALDVMAEVALKSILEKRKAEYAAATAGGE